MFYSDDSVLLAPSARALQKMVEICFKYGNDQELKYNFKKTECMCVNPKWLKQLKMPNIFMGCQKPLKQKRTQAVFSVMTSVIIMTLKGK